MDYLKIYREAIIVGGETKEIVVFYPILLHVPEREKEKKNNKRNEREWR